MSAKEFIKYNDMKSAFEKWVKANKQWKAHWFKTCVTIFENSKKWAKDYFIDPICKTITKIKHSVSTDNIIWECPQVKYPKDTELFYLIKCVDKNGNVIFSKVGTTTRTVQQRMKEHLKAYKDLGVVKIIVNKVYDCDVEAEGFESWFRAIYIRKYKGSFKKNDRFFCVDFDLEEADKIFKAYQNLTF